MEVQKSDSLRELLDKFNEDPDSFDPEKVIGELEGKVDAIKWRRDAWLAEAKMIDEEWICQLAKRSVSLKNAVKRLEGYVQTQLVTRELPGLQGKMFRVQVQKSTPSVEVPHNAGPLDFLNYPKYVRQDITYAWNKETLKDDLTAGEVPVPNACIKQGQHIRFYPAKGEKK